MEDRASYGKERRLKKEITFENGKAIIFEYDCTQMEEEAFAQALENAQKSHPKTMKEFLYSLHKVLASH
jgi:hypothetical protein